MWFRNRLVANKKMKTKKKRTRKPNIEKLCKKWQGLLGLKDWDIKIIWARQFEGLSDKLGSCGYAFSKRSALIKIVDPIDYPTDTRWPNDVELTVVHELLHLHFAMLSPTDGSVEDKLLEQAIEAISNAAVALDRRAA